MTNTASVNRLVRMSVQHSRTVTILVFVTVICLAMILLFGYLFTVASTQEPDPVDYYPKPTPGEAYSFLQELEKAQQEAAEQKRSIVLALCMIEAIAFAGTLVIVWIVLEKKLRSIRSAPEAYYVCVVRAINSKMGEDGVIRDCGIEISPNVRFSPRNLKKVKNMLLRELNYRDAYVSPDELKEATVTVMYNTKTDRLLTFALGAQPKTVDVS